jgi:hypothetical protein
MDGSHLCGRLICGLTQTSRLGRRSTRHHELQTVGGGPGHRSCTHGHRMGPAGTWLGATERVSWASAYQGGPALCHSRFDQQPILRMERAGSVGRACRRASGTRRSCSAREARMADVGPGAVAQNEGFTDRHDTALAAVRTFVRTPGKAVAEHARGKALGDARILRRALWRLLPT